MVTIPARRYKMRRLKIPMNSQIRALTIMNFKSGNIYNMSHVLYLHSLQIIVELIF
jgi:hypothetical protein